MNLRIEIGKPKTDGTCKAYILIGSCNDKQRIPTNVTLYQGEFKKTPNGLKILNFEKDFRLINELNTKVIDFVFSEYMK